MSNWKTHVFLPDIQAPEHDNKFVNALVDFVADVQPDTLVQVGDMFDSPEPARWSKGMATEFAGTFYKGIQTGTEILERFRNVYDGPFALKEGNHDLRAMTYVRRYAPALSDIPYLQPEMLFGLDDLGIDYKREIFDVAPGWVVAHGHEGGGSRIAGGVAMGIARRTGKSVICGHTHKVGFQSESHGYNGRLRDLHGMEVGHAMDIRKAHYLKTGGANWQQGVGVLLVKGRTVLPFALKATNGMFVWEGQTYGERAA